MRSIPAALRQKLLNRFKADDTDSKPNIRLVATQTSINTLLSEPIHEDIAPALGEKRSCRNIVPILDVKVASLDREDIGILLRLEEVPLLGGIHAPHAVVLHCNIGSCAKCPEVLPLEVEAGRKAACVDLCNAVVQADGISAR